MATALPYLPSNKNVDLLFNKIHTAKIPDKFSQAFLSQTLGLKGSNDRPLIPLLRTLGFLDQSGNPTPSYRKLKNDVEARGVIAQAIRNAYAPLFEANEAANKLPADRLKGLVAQVAGTDEGMTARIVSTFNSLSKLADFSATAAEDETSEEEQSEEEPKAPVRAPHVKPMKPEFHYNIQVHLPSNATEEVYLSIFNALRKSFQ